MSSALGSAAGWWSMIGLLTAVGCSNDKAPAAKVPEVTVTRIDGLGLELALPSGWHPGGPAKPAPDEASFYRGASSEAPDASLTLLIHDLALADADDDHLLQRTKDTAQSSTGNTCQIIRDGDRRLGRCVGQRSGLTAIVYTLPDGKRTIGVLYLSSALAGAPALAEADAIVATLRAP